MSTPWNILVLTHDYLIEGQIDGSDIMQKAIFNLTGRGLDNRTDVTLTGVKIYPTGSLQIPAANMASWTVGVTSSVVAVIPNDSMSAKEAMGKRELTPVEMVVGQYLIRGNMFVTLKYKYREVAVGSSTLQDAEITRLSPDSKLKGYKVPLIVVNHFWLQGVSFR